MSVYYNENDPFAANWLDKLTEAREITPGRIDRRSIRDVVASDLENVERAHFFAGIGGWDYALKLAGWPESLPVWTGSCPCQPFSVAGKRKGTADDRHLWPVWNQLISERRPTVVFGEQVASPDGLKWLDTVSADLENSGYAFGASDLCAASVGAPHIRQRLYFVAYANVERLQRIGLHLQQLEPRTALLEASGSGEPRGLADSHKFSSGQGSEIRSGRDHGMRSTPRAGFSGGEYAGVASGVVGNASRKGTGRNARTVLSPQEEGDRERIKPRYLADQPVDAGTTSELGDSERSRLERRIGSCRPNNPFIGTASMANDRPWNNPDWIYCRDGKARPVEPGTFPLAHGVPARVGRLRGYGNAIVPWVAAMFITAFMDAMGLGLSE